MECRSPQNAHQSGARQTISITAASTWKERSSITIMCPPSITAILVLIADKNRFRQKTFEKHGRRMSMPGRFFGPATELLGHMPYLCSPSRPSCILLVSAMVWRQPAERGHVPSPTPGHACRTRQDAAPGRELRGPDELDVEQGLEIRADSRRPAPVLLQPLAVAVPRVVDTQPIGLRVAAVAQLPLRGRQRSAHVVKVRVAPQQLPASGRTTSPDCSNFVVSRPTDGSSTDPFPTDRAL
jgi:hypothetical protein